MGHEEIGNGQENGPGYQPQEAPADRGDSKGFGHKVEGHHGQHHPGRETKDRAEGLLVQSREDGHGQASEARAQDPGQGAEGGDYY